MHDERSAENRPGAALPGDSIPLGFVIASAGELAASGFRDALAPHGVSPRHYSVLWALSTHGEHTQQQLSERLGIPASRVVSLIDDLEQRSAVRRLVSPSDRRVRTVQLTHEGRTLLTALWGVAQRYQARLLGDLTDDEQRTLRRLLARVSSTLGSPESVDRVRSW